MKKQEKLITLSLEAPQAVQRKQDPVSFIKIHAVNFCTYQASC